MKILAVDDKSSNLLVLRSILGSVNAEILEAGSGDEALKLALKHEFALAILDVEMPGMDGYELAGHLRQTERTARIPVIFLTAAFTSDDDMAKAFDTGAVDYLVKPYAPWKLVKKVEALLNVQRQTLELEAQKKRLELHLHRQKELEIAITESRHNMETVISRSTDGILILDPDGTVLFANPAAETVTGRDATELINAPFGIPLAEHGKTDIVIARHDNASVEAEMTVTGVEWDGRDCMMVTLRDVSASKTAERMQALSNAVLRIINEAGSADECMRKTAQCVREATGIAAFCIRRRTRDDFPYVYMEGCEPHDYLDDRAECRCRNAGAPEPDGVPAGCPCDAVLRGAPPCGNVRITDRGSFWTNNATGNGYNVSGAFGRLAGEGCNMRGGESIALVPLRSHTGIDGLMQLADPRRNLLSADMISVLENIGNHIGIAFARFRLEEEKENMRAQLLQSQKMEAVGTLAGGVAHDFNNLLTIIKGNIELLLMDRKDGTGVSKELVQINEAADRAARLTRQLLMFSRKHHLEFVPLDLNNVVADLSKMMRRLIGEDISIDIELMDDVPMVKGDPSSLEQLVMNLIVNARDAMSGGGRIYIRTSNVTLTGMQAEGIPFSRPGDFVVISITDTGHGMDGATISRVFEPFFTTKETGKGTGLGLSVVYGILQKHDGWINIFSEPEHGTTFRIYLPAVADSRKTRSADDAKSGTVLKGENRKVLFVEDEASVRNVGKRILENYGFTVTEAVDCTDARRRWQENGPDFFLVLSDVVLPDGSGLDLVEAMSATRPDIKIILSSGYTGMKAKWESIHEKGYVFLQKPYTLDDMVTALEKVVAVEMV